MVITTVLLYVVARDRWRWHPLPAAALMGVFLVVDLAFFGANIIKVAQGGWLPLVLASVVFLLMTTWKAGRRVLSDRIQTEARPLTEFLADLRHRSLTRVPGTAVFMNGTASRTPAALRHNVEHNKVLHERVIFVTVKTRQVPHVAGSDRFDVEDLGVGIYRVKVHYGFMEEPHIPDALRQMTDRGLAPVDPSTTTYFLGRETIIATRGTAMSLWRERLFAFLARNATTATAYFNIPPERVVELGEQVEI
jgi:KUP system potassium uptake protein